MVAPGGHGCSQEGACVVARGACMVAPRGACIVFAGWACVVFAGGACIGYDKIRSMSGRYASYWNAFLFQLKLPV